MSERPLMQRNASPPSMPPSPPQSSEDLARELWQLLDDIDTASDMFKPKHDGFYRYVMAKAEARHAFATSDGYNLKLNTK